MSKNFFYGEDEIIAKTTALMGLIAFFIVVIVGMAFLNSASNTTNPLTDVQSKTNLSFTGINNTAVNVTGTNFVAVSAVRNATQSTLTVTTDYTINTTTGSITVLTGNGTYYTDYTYKSVDYVADGASRNLIRLIPFFLALAILLGGIGYVNRDELGQLFK